MSLRSSLLILGGGLLSLSAVAIAQNPAPASGPAHKGPPANRAELRTMLEKHFDAADANRDGTVTPQERTAYRAQSRERMRDHVFARLDANKDGQISKAEFAALRPGGDHARGKGHGEGRPHRGMMHGKMMGGGDFAAMRDKPVTRAQFVDAGLARFDRVDTDHDGKISSAERDAARKAMRDRLAPANMPPPPPPGL